MTPYPWFDRATMEWKWPDGSSITLRALRERPEYFKPLANRLTLYNILTFKGSPRQEPSDNG